MFERFNEGARQVVVLAQDEARVLKHNYIGTEHILLGLLREEEGLAARILESLDITGEEVRAQVVRIVGQSDVAVTGQIPFTPRGKKVLEFALREALSLGQNHIGTEHILLGLTCEKESVAVRVLTTFGAGTQMIREETIRVIGRPGRRQTDEGFPRGQDSVIELGLRRVVPVGQQMSDGTWIVSVEVWDNGVVVRYATSQRPYRPPLGGTEWHGWLISDDVGTSYARVAAGGGGSPQRGYYGDANFEPAPPSTATTLDVRHEGANDVVSVALID